MGFGHYIFHLPTRGWGDHTLLFGIQSHFTVGSILAKCLEILLTLKSAAAIQHICMAKALIQEYELRNLYASPEQGQDTNTIEVRIL
jgi:hypothetical protein